MLLLSYLATFQMCVSGHFEETRGGGAGYRQRCAPYILSSYRGQNEISGGEFEQCLEDGEIKAGSKCFLKNRYS